MGKGLGIAALPHAEAQMKKRINRVPHAERRRAAADLEGFAHSAAAEGKSAAGGKAGRAKQGRASRAGKAGRAGGKRGKRDMRDVSRT